MKKSLSLLCLMLLSLGLLFNTSYAKRFGGGKSFGTQRLSYSQSHTPAQSMTKNISNRASSWLGPIAGLITGGLLASLFMGHGLGTGLVTWLLAGIVIFAIFSFIRNRMQPSLSQSGFQHQERSQAIDPGSFYRHQSTMQPATAISDYPADFNADHFLREAKSQFIRLQTAYDQKNLNDLRQFTTPEVFAEIQLQLQERGQEINQTDVVQLDATLLEVSRDGSYGDQASVLVSVKFAGLIKEKINEPASPFSEIWNFRKDSHSNSWLVAGLQQSLS